MPAPFTETEQRRLKAQLLNLYAVKNKPLKEISNILNLSESGVYGRLKRLNIPITPWLKQRFSNQRQDLKIPSSHSEDLAEFVGIMLGDGQITPTQIWVTSHWLNDRDYHHYIKNLIHRLFNVEVKSLVREQSSVINCYVGSVGIVRFLKSMGFVENKVKMQVKIPNWIFKKKLYQKACLRGLIDTDGSIYKIKSGSVQLSFKNFSIPLLEGARKILVNNYFNPSQISSNTVYLTREEEIIRYFYEIKTSNPKHLYRFLKFKGGSHSGNCTAL